MCGFRRVYRSGVALLLGVLVGSCMLRLFEHKQVYYPDRTFSVTGAELGRPYEDIWFDADDGVKLNGWFYPAAAASARSSWVVLVCHGNAGNIGHRLGTAEALLACGVGVLLFDYRGYGRSQGRPTEEGTYSDAMAAHRWLRNKGFAAKRILVLGESLGGGVIASLERCSRLGDTSAASMLREVSNKNTTS